MNKKYLLSLAFVTLVSAFSLQAVDMDGVKQNLNDGAEFPARVVLDSSLQDVATFTLSKLPLLNSVLNSPYGAWAYKSISGLIVLVAGRLAYQNKEKLGNAKDSVKRFVGLGKDCNRSCDTQADKSECTKRSKEWAKG